MTVVENTSVRSPERNVYVIDDDRDIRQSLHFLLATSQTRVWPFAAAADFFELLPSLKPAPILLDMRMPKMDGIEVLQELPRHDVPWPVIMMTAHGDIATAVRAVKLGAVEFLEKPFSSALLDQALTAAFETLGSIEKADASRSHARLLLDRLTARENDIIAILIEGASNKLAAYRLNLSVRTIEMHRKNALAKLQLKSIAEVVVLITAAERNMTAADK